MEDYITAHTFSSNHKDRLLEDQRCGCFYCLEIFAPREIIDWVEDVDGTAICPYCGVDSIVGEHSGYSITREFLEKMRSYWFGDNGRM